MELDSEGSKLGESAEQSQNKEPKHPEDRNSGGHKGVMEWWESDFYADGGIEAVKELSEEGEYEVQPPPVIKSVLGRNSAVEHLQDIAHLQFNIMTLLKKIEQRSRGNKKCSANNLKEQQAAITDMQIAMDMKVPQLSAESRLVDHVGSWHGNFSSNRAMLMAR